jgi:hypothetical protein
MGDVGRMGIDSSGAEFSIIVEIPALLISMTVLPPSHIPPPSSH